MAKGSADPAAVGKLMIEIQGLEKQIHQVHEAARNSLLEMLTPDQKTRFQAVQDTALLPVAAREAVALGLVPGAPRMQGMQGRIQGEMRGPMQGGRIEGQWQQQGPNPGMGRQRPMMGGRQGQMGPGGAQPGFRRPEQGPGPDDNGPRPPNPPPPNE